MHTVTAGGKTLSVFPATEPEAPVIYLNTVSGEGQALWDAAQAGGFPPMTLVAISDLDWNCDMVPWDSPAVFRNAEPFTGGADRYLQLLTEELVPLAELELPGRPCWRGIAGYSLAGLFALYAIYQTDIFSRVASMSGSLWFPGMKEYIFSHQPKRLPDAVYVSLGDKESKTRNPVLRNVRRDTEEIHAFYQAQGVETAFRLHPGNHYAHTIERTADGILWMLSR